MPYYYTRDQIASVRELVDGSGTIQARYKYDPYGVATLVSGTNMATFQYTGDYYHAASGLNLTLAGDGQSTGRAYDPAVGRWLSRDPINEQGGINLYQYVKNMPIEAIDPLGLTPDEFGWFDAGMADGEHHGWAEDTNWLIFHPTCPAGQKVNQVKIIYNSWEGGWGTVLNLFKNPGAGFVPDPTTNLLVQNVNCDGKPTTVNVWENSRFAGSFALSIYPNRYNYKHGTHVLYTCKCCK
jgi:RHS repeat-associated protein